MQIAVFVVHSGVKVYGKRLCLILKRKKSSKKNIPKHGLSHLYKTENSEEEAACPFLGKNGCVLSESEKPFDCSIWPLRACKINGKIQVMLENTCPVINKQPVENINALLKSGLREKIISHAEKNTDMIKEFLPEFALF